MTAYIRMASWKRTNNTNKEVYYSNIGNNIGILPPGWRVFKDEDDIWYQQGNTVTWNRPNWSEYTMPTKTRRTNKNNILDISTYINNATRSIKAAAKAAENKALKNIQNAIKSRTMRLKNLNVPRVIQNVQNAEKRAQNAETAAKETMNRYKESRQAFNVSQSRSRSAFRPTNGNTAVVLKHLDSLRKAAKQATLAATQAKKNAVAARLKAAATQKVRANKEAALSKFSGYATQTTAKGHRPVEVMTEEELKRLRGWRPIINLKP